MKYLLISIIITLTSVITQAVPRSINYQGLLQIEGQPYTGQGLFKFAIVVTGGPGEVTVWSNDGTSINGSEPNEYLLLDVTRGLFHVALGAETDGPTIDPGSFGSRPLVLRVWFSTGGEKFTQLGEDRVLRSSPFALKAATVADGAISSDHIADGAITASHIANDAIGAAQLADELTARSLNLGDFSADGNLSLFGRQATGGFLDPNQQNERVFLYSNAPGTLIPTPTLGGGIDLFDSEQSRRVSLRADGALISLTDDDGSTGLILLGDTISGGGALTVNRASGGIGATLLGESGAGGRLSLYDDGSREQVRARGDLGTVVATNRLGVASSAVAANLDAYLGRSANGSGQLSLRDASGDVSLRLEGAVNSSSGSRIELREADGSLSVRIGAEGSGGGGFMSLRDGAGNTVIELDASEGGESIIRTQVLEITGGSDLSEKFITGEKLEPGTLVCIDQQRPGALCESSTSYDRTVAGIVSGAGGIQTGMLMGQKGSLTDGECAVALTGRVFAKATAANGAIKPGDLLTTSELPGMAMKVTDHSAAAGAIIGKAMTSLDSGDGLVLVLVSLQ